VDINIAGIQCAGVSFTAAFKNKYIEYVNIIEKNKNKELFYTELQELIKNETSITESAVRVDIPFLFNSGFINDYKQDSVGKIKMKSFITNLGKIYYEVVEIKKILNDDKVIEEYINEIESLLIIESLKYRLNNFKDEYYIKMLKFIFDNQSMNVNEFYLMVLYENTPNKLKELVTAYRNNEIEINLLGTNNAYQYTKRVLLQADLLFEKEGQLIINPKWYSLIQIILKGEI